MRERFLQNLDAVLFGLGPTFALFAAIWAVNLGFLRL